MTTRRSEHRTLSPRHLARLKEVIQGHRGSRHSIRARDLVVILGITADRYADRTIRELVNGLIDQGIPIGSINLESGGGYFVVETEVELATCVRSLEGRAREIQKKADRLKEAFHHGPAQPSLLAP